jgi:hypothetical protein
MLDVLSTGEAEIKTYGSRLVLERSCKSLLTRTDRRKSFDLLIGTILYSTDCRSRVGLNGLEYSDMVTSTIYTIGSGKLYTRFVRYAHYCR